MATTLTRAKQMTRMILLGMVGLVVAGVFFAGVLRLVGQLSNPNTNPAAQANVAFGELPGIRLPDLGISAETADVSLDLVSGSFPRSPSLIQVYQVAQPSLSLSSQDRARGRAGHFGFREVSPTTESEELFSWRDNNRTFEFWLANQTFSLTTRSLSEINMPNRQSFTSAAQIAQPTASFVSNMLYATDLNFSAPTTRFVNPQGNTFIPQPGDATSLTNYAEVTLLRNNLNDFPLYTAWGKRGPVSAVVVPPLRSAEQSVGRSVSFDYTQVVQFESTYLPINKDRSATYPVIDGNTAYELLKSRFTQSLTSVEPANSSSLPTTVQSARVLFASLAYLEPDPDNNEYVLPVWFFEGRASTNVGEAYWTAMVPALDEGMMRRLLR